MVGEKLRSWEQVATLLLVGLALGTLVFQQTTNTIPNQEFFQIYVFLLVFTIIGAAISVLFNVINTARQNAQSSLARRGFSTSSPSVLDFFNNPFLRYGVVVAVTILVVVGVALQGSLVPVPDPQSASLSQVTETSVLAHSGFLNTWNISVYPGIGEEGAAFFLNLILLAIVGSILALIFFRDIKQFFHPFVFLPSMLVSVSVTAFIFAAAHAQAYGLDGTAYVVAFGFEWVMQAMNTLLGGFYSWLPHLFHNAIVVYGLQYSLSFGAAALAGFVFFSQPKKAQAGLGVLSALAVVALLAVLLFTVATGNFFSLSNFGEERFNPYDPLLDGGSYSPALWSSPSSEYVTASAGLLRYSLPLNQAASAGSTASHLGTRSFFLEDYRFEYQIDRPHGINSAKVFIRISDDGAAVLTEELLFGQGANSAQGVRATGDVKIVYNDLANGEFQVFLNGASTPAYQGTGTTRVAFVYSHVNAQSSYTYETQIINPRVATLFGCDPQAGEALVDACVAGATYLERDELPEWSEGQSRFCLENPAQHTVAGLTSSSSRVYYELAQDGLVIEDNEVWRFNYITPGDPGVVTIGSLCEEQTVTDDLDLPETQLLGNKKVIWTAHEEDRSFTSGSQALFVASSPEYTCAATDGHDPTGDTRTYAEAPGCWEFPLTSSDNPFTSKVLDRQATFKYGDEYGLGTVTDWGTTYELTLADDYFTIAGADINDEELTLDITNHYETADAVILVLFDAQVINQPLTRTAEATLPSGSTSFSLTVPAEFDTDYDADVKVFLVTEAGNLDGSEQFTINIQETGGSTQATVTEKGFWATLWDWIKGWFA